MISSLIGDVFGASQHASDNAGMQNAGAQNASNKKRFLEYRPSLGASEVEPGFERLAAVLYQAYSQAAFGKGKERHANGKPFHEQPMQDLIRLNGLGFAVGQACKKSTEALNFASKQKSIDEMLGAIVYLAGAVISLERSIAQDQQGGLSSQQTLMERATKAIVTNSQTER